MELEFRYINGHLCRVCGYVWRVVGGVGGSEMGSPDKQDELNVSSVEKRCFLLGPFSPTMPVNMFLADSVCGA